MVQHRDVIADEYQWPAKIVQIFLTADFGSRHDPRDRQHNGVKQRDTQPTDGPAPLPAWIRIGHCRFLFAFPNQLLHFAQGGCLSEGGFIKLDSIRIFQST